jgi:ribose-phosphate pyrophosphokinase
VSKGIATSRGRLLIASCRSGVEMAALVVERLRKLRIKSGSEDDLIYLDNVDGQFSDSEIFARLSQDVSDGDVYLFQALLDPISGPSVDQNYMAFLIAIRAVREWGANHVTGILPYLAYERQDKPTLYEREPAKANLLADISIVAPDAGASKFVSRIGRELDLNVATASKYRPRPEEATIQEVVGDFPPTRMPALTVILTIMRNPQAGFYGQRCIRSLLPLGYRQLPAWH